MVQGLAATADGAQQLRTASDELLPALLWLMNDESHVSKAALTSLVNLSQVRTRREDINQLPRGRPVDLCTARRRSALTKCWQWSCASSVLIPTYSSFAGWPNTRLQRTQT